MHLYNISHITFTCLWLPCWEVGQQAKKLPSQWSGDGISAFEIGSLDIRPWDNFQPCLLRQTYRFFLMRKTRNATTVSCVVLKLGQNIGTDVDSHNQQQSNLRLALSETLQNTAILALGTPNFTPGMNVPPLGYLLSWCSGWPVYDNDSFCYITKGAESEHPTSGWAAETVKESCFPHSGGWHNVFHNMGLTFTSRYKFSKHDIKFPRRKSLPLNNCISSGQSTKPQVNWADTEHM